MPTSFEWNLPENFQLISQREPTPTRHMEEGITTFIHEEEAIYLFKIQAPDEVADSNSFSVHIDWLECNDLCRPGSSTHHFILPPGESMGSEKAEWTDLVERAQLSFPQAFPEVMGQLVHRGDHLELVLKYYPWSQKLLSADFFPFDEMIYDTGTAVHIKRGLLRERIIFPLKNDLSSIPEALQGVLVQNRASPSGPKTTNSIIYKQLQ